MTRKIFLGLLFFVLLFCPELYAEPYFSGDEIAPTLIDPPFEIGSKEWQQELRQILKMQKKFDLDEIDKALSEKHLQPETVAQFADTSITRKSYPKLYHLLDRVGETSRSVNDVVKTYWNQQRPYRADKRINALIALSEGRSYPSGHATGSHVYAHILGVLMPQKRQQFEDRAEKISYRRVLVGMHYPHDLVGGKQLALIIVGALMQNSDFKKDLKAAQKEIVQPQ